MSILNVTDSLKQACLRASGQDPDQAPLAEVSLELADPLVLIAGDDATGALGPCREPRGQFAVLRRGQAPGDAWLVDLWEVVRIGCRGADLSGLVLAGADLEGADLAGADLSEADLSRANLTKAHLNRTRLRGANLSGASLYSASLCDADLLEADLSRADLRHVDLRGAELSRAALRGADLWGAYLWDVDLSKSFVEGVDVARADDLSDKVRAEESS